MESIENTIKDITNEISKIDDVMAVLLYGSASRGDYSPRHSDIDIMLFFNKKDAPKRIQKLITAKLLDISARHKVKIHPEFQGTVIRKADETLMQKILEEGKVIYSKGAFILLGKRVGLEPFYLYKFSTRSASKRAMLSRALHGGWSWYYKDSKKIKKKYSGIVDNISIVEIGRGSLLVKKDHKQHIESMFSLYGTDYSVMKIVYA